MAIHVSFFAVQNSSRDWKTPYEKNMGILFRVTHVVFHFCGRASFIKIVPESGKSTNI
jgi:hypothetical protein